MKWATDRGIRAHKNDPRFCAGFPDRTFYMPGGKPVLIEFKAPGEGPTPLQQDTIDELRGMGYDVQVIDNKEEAIQYLTSKLGTARLPEKKRKVPRNASSGRPVPRPRTRKD